VLDGIFADFESGLSDLLGNDLDVLGLA
jgi:hypothetical protein